MTQPKPNPADVENHHPPYQNPENRAEARANAIFYAELAADNLRLDKVASISTGYMTQSQVWSSIAATFPDQDYVVAMADDTPQFVITEDRDPLASEPSIPGVTGDIDRTVIMQTPDHVGVVGPSGYSAGDRGTIVVDSMAWDVLRVLAARYVRTSFNKKVTIPMGEDLDGANAAIARLYSIKLWFFPDRVEATPDSDV